MAVLETWQVITVTFLGLVALLLTVFMFVVTVVCLKKRRLVCFIEQKKRKKKDDEEALYPFRNDKAKRKRRRRRLVGQENKKKFSDPFAKTFLDPINMEDFDTHTNDWDNPLFDVQAARRKDAAITIQTWWRMAR